MREERKSERRGSVDPREWVEAYGDVLYRFARARLPDVETAEDVVQETFLAALEARDTFAGESTEQTWLVGILRRKIVDHYRQAARKRGGERAAGAVREFDTRGKWISDPQEWQFDPAAIAADREFWQIFEECRSQLPEKLAEAYRLREDAELTTEEICQVLGISASNVWTQLYRARLLLRKCIEGKWFQRPL
jgi:RNA polymerase sigma-70 factor (ECF subfamily)